MLIVGFLGKKQYAAIPLNKLTTKLRKALRLKYSIGD